MKQAGQRWMLMSKSQPKVESLTLPVLAKDAEASQEKTEHGKFMRTP